MTFAEFSTALTSLAKDDLPAKINAVVQRVATRVDEEVVAWTPVDTGLGRSSWLVSLDTPDETVLEEAYVPGEHLGLYETENRDAAWAQGASIIAQRKPGQVIYINNTATSKKKGEEEGIKYIGWINSGEWFQLYKLRPENEDTEQYFVDMAILAAIHSLGSATLLARTAG